MASEITGLILDSLAREMRVYLGDVEEDARRILDGENINFTEATRNALHHDANVSGGQVLGEIGSRARHAIIVHDGRGPNKPMPPDAPIREWLRLKVGVPEDELDRATFLVRRKIGRKGTKGTKFLERPLEARQPTLLPRLRAALLQDLDGADLFPNLRG